MSSKSTFQPSSSLAWMDFKVPGGTAALPWLVFSLHVFLQRLFQQRLQQVSFDQGTKLVTFLTLWPTVITEVSPAPITCSTIFIYRYGEQNLFEVSDTERKKERGKMPSQHTRQHTYEGGSSLTDVKGTHTHQGTGLVSTQINKPLQSLSLQTNPWLRKCLLMCFIWPWQKYEARDRIMRKELKRYSQMTTRNQCPRGRKVSLWPDCKRMGKEKVQKWVREGKV